VRHGRHIRTEHRCEHDQGRKNFFHFTVLLLFLLRFSLSREMVLRDQAGTV